MSYNVLERNETISNMPNQLSVQPNNSANLATCRFCGAGLRHTFVDLGMSPPCEAILERTQLNQMEAFYPLHVFVCDRCFLVQLQEYVTAEDIFTEYAYFSSYSDSWLAHAKAYTTLMIERFKLNAQSQVVELASNDGYLLQYFAEAGIPVLGIEPAANVAKVATDKGVPTLVNFFGAELAEELLRDGTQADLLLGNNVLAQVPDLRSFVKGMKTLLKPHGIITLEFPHLMRLIEENQFDTIYHEHFSYFSFLTVVKREGNSVASYGPSRKESTLLNYDSISSDLLDYTVDRNPYNHGKFLAGMHIPVFDTDKIRKTKPDYVLILPWNMKSESSGKL